MNDAVSARRGAGAHPIGDICTTRKGKAHELDTCSSRVCEQCCFCLTVNVQGSFCPQGSHAPRDRGIHRAGRQRQSKETYIQSGVCSLLLYKSRGEGATTESRVRACEVSDCGPGCPDPAKLFGATQRVPRHGGECAMRVPPRQSILASVIASVTRHGARQPTLPPASIAQPSRWPSVRPPQSVSIIMNDARRKSDCSLEMHHPCASR